MSLSLNPLLVPSRPFMRYGRAQLWNILAALALSLLLLPMSSKATEEPDYTVIRTYPDFEIREYASYAVAEVLLAGPSSEAASQAFPILAGYIFGKNKGATKMDMTAPVTQTPVPVKLEMTAPVTQVETNDGVLVQFVLPRGVTAQSAPLPLDARIRIRQLAPHRVAVIRYSGFWSDANYDKHLTKLQAALLREQLVASGEPVYSRYNPPFTPWFLRRNEIWLYLADAP